MSTNIFDEIKNQNPRLLLRRITHVLPFLFAILTLAFLVWSGYFLIVYPYDGLIINNNTKEILSVDPFGPTSNLIEVGDVVEYLEYGIMPNSFPPYILGSVNEEQEVRVLRGETYVVISYELSNPPVDEIFERLIPVVVSSMFWLIGLLVLAYQPRENISMLFFANTQFGSIALMSGELNRYDFTIMEIIFVLVLFLIGPLSVHFHQNFPRKIVGKEYLFCRNILYLASLLGAGVLLIFELVRPGDPNFHSQMNLIAKIFLTGCWLIVFGTLIRTYKTSSGQNDIGIIRLVSFGGILGISPFLLLSIINIFIGDEFFLPISDGLLFLGMIPLTYGYSIFRHRLLPIENRVSRPATQILVISFVTGFYFILLTLIKFIVPAEMFNFPLFLAVIVLILGSSVRYVKLYFNKALDNIFYGGWYDYRNMMVMSSQELLKTHDRKRLAEQALNILRTMHFDAGVIYLSDGKALTPEASFGGDNIFLITPYLPCKGELGKYLLRNLSPSWREDIGSSIQQDRLFQEEKKVLEFQLGRLYIPLVSRNALRGLVILQTDIGKEWMSQEEVDILRTIAAFIAIASENVSLLEELRTQLTRLEEARADLAESRKSLAEGREYERLHLARELHDGPIQDLYAFHLKYGNLAAEGVSKSVEDMSNRILSVIHDLRDLCAHLRPPVLAYFGFEPAVQSLVNKFNADHPEINVKLDITPDGPTLVDSQKIALYRILQEALNNVGQHAQADEVLIQYATENGRMSLNVIDNGKGFSIPVRWVELARRGHLGLLGISERAESFGGLLTINSGPEFGTVLRVIAPVIEMEKSDNSKYYSPVKEIV